MATERALILNYDGEGGYIHVWDGMGLNELVADDGPYCTDGPLGPGPLGMSIWEGESRYWAGAYRRLTDAEWARLQEGLPPWDEDHDAVQP